MIDRSRVSVIVPVYNRAEIIRRAVESLERQQFGLPFEIIVVDDGSTDASAAIAEAVGGRVRVVRQENRGASAARRAGVLAARSEVVTFLDSDDVALPNKLAVLWERLHRRTGVTVSFAASVDSADPAHAIALSCAADMDVDGILQDPLAVLLRRGCFIPSMNMMTFRDLADRASAGREHVLASNDYDLFLRLALEGPFCGSNEPTIACERRSDGLSSRRGVLQVGFSIVAMEEAVAESGRRDPDVVSALRDRVQDTWPSAFVLLWRQGHWRLLARVAAIGLRRSRWGRSARLLWWALQAPRVRPEP